MAVAVVDYLVLPQIAGTEKSLHLLGAVRPWWLAAGVALEALSLVCYSLLTRAVLQDRRVRYPWLLRADLTGLGVSHLLPGGGATATALRYRWLVAGGVSSENATVSVAVEGVGSILALASVLWIGLVAAIVLSDASAVYLVAAVVMTVIGACIFVAVHERSRLARPAGRALRFLLRAVPARFRGRVEAWAGNAAAHLGLLLADRRALRACATWAMANWLLDAASLWVFLAAYGHALNPASLLIAYAVANLLAVLPISPGGLGIVEGAMIPSLLGFSVPAGIAVLGVVSWRLFEFWAPIPVSGLTYLSLRTQQWWTRRRVHVPTRRASPPEPKPGVTRSA